MKAKTITEFKKLFKESVNLKPIDKEVMYIEDSNVLGVVPKTKGFDNAFKGVFESEKKDKDLSLSIEDKDYQIAKFSSEYFKIITQILSTLDEPIILKVKEDNPLIIETEHFKIILAPRVETD